ncbi:MAG: PKD domain-containing protein, partial [Isosphaeraceae bacterium]|nr:PKD domain-containing protein [Isosphaeraceae bacterium]
MIPRLWIRASGCRLRRGAAASTAVALFATMLASPVAAGVPPPPSAGHRFFDQTGGAVTAASVLAPNTGATSGSDWPKYLGNLGSSGFTSENLITPANVSSLKLAAGWPVQGNGTISTQPVVANNLVYWGSWDGLEHATPLPGSSSSGWATNLGQTSASGCDPSTAGVASTGAISSVTLSGQTSPRSVLFVGGGGNNSAGGGYAQLYALDALTGDVLWHTALGVSPSHFMWSSPAVYSYTNSSGTPVTSVYVGVASFGDCPLVQGQVVELDAGSGQIQNTFTVVPNGCTGGGVWGSPTVDQSDGSLYVTTGNPGSCSTGEPYAVALIKLRAADLSLLSAWQIPTSEQVTDGDFGAAATLFNGTVSSSGSPRSLVGVPNKNGTYYVFDRTAVGSGPVARLGTGASGSCPECGDGSISPSAWDGSTLYVAGGSTSIKGTTYPGSVRAWNPNSLAAPLWEVGMPDGAVLGAVAGTPGLVAVGEGSFTEVLSASTGNVVLRVPVASIGSSSPATFYGAPSIAYGTLFEGDTLGNLYAYTTSSGPTPPTAVATATPTSGTAPLTVAFDGSGSSDPNAGATLSYSWDLNGDGVFGDSTAIKPSFTYSAAGTYTASLRVTDSLGLTSNTATVTITVTSTTGSAYATAIAGLSPVAYWRFGEASGTTAADSAGTNTGTYAGAPTLGVPGLLTGDSNTAVQFEGTDDQVTVPNAASLNPTSAISVAAWINAAAGSWTRNPRILQKGSSDNQYRLLVESGLLVFNITGVGTASVAPPSTGTRHFIVGTYDGSAIRLYVDGVLAATSAATGAIPTTTDPLAIGNKPLSTHPYDPFAGILDEVSIHSIALSASQIGQLWNAGTTSSGPTPPTAVATATPTSGTAPLTVAFDGSGSS